MERISVSDLMAHAEAELAKARQSHDPERAEADIAKWEELLEGLRSLQERRQVELGCVEKTTHHY